MRLQLRPINQGLAQLQWVIRLLWEVKCLTTGHEHLAAGNQYVFGLMADFRGLKYTSYNTGVFWKSAILIADLVTLTPPIMCISALSTQGNTVPLDLTLSQLGSNPQVLCLIIAYGCSVAYSTL